MSGKFENLTAVDKNGVVLLSDGTGDCRKHEQDFDRYMKSKGYGGIIDDEDWEVPSRPNAAFARKNYNVATRDDDYDISAFNKANIPHINRCNVVLEVWKRTKSQDVLKWLKQFYREEFEEATKENIWRLRDWFMEKYGDWTVEKGKLNYLSASTIPKIIDVASADQYFYQLDLLRRERDSWTTERYDDGYYRNNLMEHIADWDRLRSIHTKMEVDNNITFAQAEIEVMALIDIDRRKLKLAETSAKFLIEMARSAGGTARNMDTGFRMADNAVVMSYEGNATVMQGQKPRSRQELGTPESVCGKCFKPGHVTSTCWGPERTERQPVLKRAMSYEEFQRKDTQARVMRNDGLCNLCKKPDHYRSR